LIYIYIFRRIATLNPELFGVQNAVTLWVHLTNSVVYQKLHVSRQIEQTISYEFTENFDLHTFKERGDNKPTAEVLRDFVSGKPLLFCCQLIGGLF